MIFSSIQKSSPQFITFEGVDGSGKTTQAKLLYEFLVKQNIKVILTREIGGTEIGEKVRDIVLHHKMFGISELLMIMAARYEHVNKVIIPNMLRGNWVICDRFVDSTATYQTGNSNISIDDIYEMHNKFIIIDNILKENHSEIDIFKLFSNNIIMPHLTFVMDIEPSTAYKRAIQRANINKFDIATLDSYNRIRDSFFEIKKKFAKRVNIIDCNNKSVDKIHNNVTSLFSDSNFVTE